VRLGKFLPVLHFCCLISICLIVKWSSHSFTRNWLVQCYSILGPCWVAWKSSYFPKRGCNEDHWGRIWVPCVAYVQLRFGWACSSCFLWTGNILMCLLPACAMLEQVIWNFWCSLIQFSVWLFSICTIVLKEVLCFLLQVYQGRTVDGALVAIKVQRPDLLPSVLRDVYILRLGVCIFSSNI